ncbi:type II secretion system F family protein [Terriglobus roseus]|uniref:Type IV pilus assembly protein PilC n=1 Tax=Terriglobus roseus TaxID=392734 RepID=A0A1G7M9K0_9BACT|nr:type II secretion system F family protein [Terriglobus roseus]SDF58433.1 type IV pilus assembly protein PilC [Terriglobus roseus]
MTEFVVKLADERGRVQEQTHPAASAEELRARFLQAGYLVYSVKPKNVLAGGSTQKKVKLQPFLVFNQQFVTLIKAGLPIPGSLELLARRQRDENFKAQLVDVAARIKTGESLSGAFDAQGGFPLIFTTTLLAGERSGNLAEVLQRYVDFQRVSLTVTKKLKSALVYPSLLIAMVLGVFVFLITFVVPRFAQLYEQLNAPLPKITMMLLALGNGAQAYGLYVLPVLLIAGYAGYRWTKTDSGANAVDRFRLMLPVMGNIWLKYQVGLFARTLSTLLTGGLPLVPSLETAARSISSRQVSNAVFASVTQVREGQGLSRSLESTNVFPELAIEMIEVGESTGALPAMLNSVGGFFEEDVDTSMAALLSLIEPLLMIVMGVVVAGILLSLYLPILQLGAGGINGSPTGQ